MQSMKNLLFPLIYIAFDVGGALKFDIVDSRGEPVASTTNETAAVLFVQLANQTRVLPTLPNVEMQD